MTFRMLFLSFSFPENLETAPKLIMVIIVSTDDADGADGTHLPALALLGSGGVIWTLTVSIDNNSATLVVRPSPRSDLFNNSFNSTMLLSITRVCWGGRT